MRITYGVTEEVYVLGDVRRISYGIAAYAHCETTQTLTIAGSVVRDISPDRSQVERLAELCSRLELDVIHLNDVVEDCLGEM